MFKVSEDTLKILNERYFYKEPLTGEQLEFTPEEMLKRVSSTVAKAEQTEDLQKYWENEFYESMINQLFMPNTPTLIGAGYVNKTLSACSVLPRIPDSLVGIYGHMLNNALLTKSGAGVGQDLSDIRPKGEIIKSSGGVSAGVVNWMPLIFAVADSTRQGDKSRRSANMVSLRFNHPDIFDFILSKVNDKSLASMNISVVIKDSEMTAVAKDLEIDLVWGGKVYGRVKARDIFNLIIDGMYKNGEPGILFYDTINKGNPFNLDGESMDENHPHAMVTSNPCGEQVLEPFEMCQLGSINLSKLYDEDSNQIDWEKFENVIQTGIRFLDNVIDINYYPIVEFDIKSKANRKIGLGVAGLAELFVKMGIRYDSEEALRVIDKIFGCKNKVEAAYNTALGIEKGSFPNHKDSNYTKPARCATISTQAPTGSIAGILGLTSYGIEPFFAIVYTRNVLEMSFVEGIELFKEMLKKEIKTEKKVQLIMDKCFRTGTAQIPEVPENLRELFRCANDISAEWHIKIQARLQKYYQNAISKTINAPEDDTKDNLYDLMIMAWKSGIKGTTYYRNNSREGQTFQIGEKANKSHVVLDSIEPIKRTDFGDIDGTTYRRKTACGTLFITVNTDDEGNIVEVFVPPSKKGTCKSNIEGEVRAVSVALRCGAKVDTVIEQLRGINCQACTNARRDGNEVDGLSCPDIISRCLELKYRGKITENVPKKKTKKKEDSELIVIEKKILNPCPECGRELGMVEGCMSCICSYSKC